MKILNLMQCTNLGGMEQASLRLMKGLKRKGHEVEVISLNPLGRLEPMLKEAGIHSVGLPYLGCGGWRTIPTLRRSLQESPADALIMTGHHLFGSLALGNKCRGRRILAIHFHHAGVKPAWQWKLIYAIACQKFSAITFPSDFVRHEGEHIHPPVRKISRTIRNPLALPNLSGTEDKLASRRMLGLPPGVPIVGNAGWLIPRKRFDVFLRVAAHVAIKCPEARFLIAGNGEERSRLEDLAESLNLTHRVIWTDWLRDMEVFYRSLDVMLFNSDWDAMGLTPLEAMSYGIPVVASVENGGLGEILDSKHGGTLLARHDMEALAAAVVRMINNPQEAQKTGLAGRERIRETTDPAGIADEYEALLLGQ